MAGLAWPDANDMVPRKTCAWGWTRHGLSWPVIADTGTGITKHVLTSGMSEDAPPLRSPSQEQPQDGSIVIHSKEKFRTV